MGKFIIKIDDFYLEWSTITDSPVTFGMRLDEFKRYYIEEYGRYGSSDLEPRLQRADEHGSSAYSTHHWPPNLYIGNRAGPDDFELTETEIYIAYCLRQPIRNGWLVPTCDGDFP